MPPFLPPSLPEEMSCVWDLQEIVARPLLLLLEQIQKVHAVRHILCHQRLLESSASRG